MIGLNEIVPVGLPAEALWSLLRDPLAVARCIPGAALEAGDEPDLYRGTMRVKFGPTVVTFHGEARLRYDPVQRACRIDGRGHDKRGATNAMAEFTVLVREDDAAPQGTACILQVDGGFTVTGPLEGFASTGGVHVARVLLKDFAVNLAAGAGAGATLNAAGIAGQAARQWASGLFKPKD